jgi:hypothetical protein
VIWLPLGVWIGGVLLAIVVVGFSAYELNWKARRLRTDLARLAALSERVLQLQTQLGDAAERVTRASQG